MVLSDPWPWRHPPRWCGDGPWIPGPPLWHWRHSLRVVQLVCPQFARCHSLLVGQPSEWVALCRVSFSSPPWPVFGPCCEAPWTPVVCCESGRACDCIILLLRSPFFQGSDFLPSSGDLDTDAYDAITLGKPSSVAATTRVTVAK